MILYMINCQKSQRSGPYRLRSHGKLYESGLCQMAKVTHQQTETTLTLIQCRWNQKQEWSTMLLHGSTVQNGNTNHKPKILPLRPGRPQSNLQIPLVCSLPTRVDWKWGWIDISQPPIVLSAPNATKDTYVPRTKNTPHPTKRMMNQYFLRRVTIGSTTTNEPNMAVPKEFQRHSKVFSEAKSQRLPQSTIWDHAIDLLLGAPNTLPGRLLPLTQEEKGEMHKFIQEHLKRGTICMSKSPYAANFFCIKQKDGKLWPVQDYQPINKWTKKNRNVPPLIPQVIDHLSRCTTVSHNCIHLLGIQQHPDQRGWWRKSHIPHPWRIIWTHSHVLWTNQLSSYIPKWWTPSSEKKWEKGGYQYTWMTSPSTQPNTPKRQKNNIPSAIEDMFIRCWTNWKDMTSILNPKNASLRKTKFNTSESL